MDKTEHEKKMQEAVEKMAEKYDISEEEIWDQVDDFIHTKGWEIEELIEHEAKRISEKKMKADT